MVRKLVLGIKAKLTAHQVHIVTGEATIVDKNTIQCGGETYECENLLLCTGSETFIPPIPVRNLLSPDDGLHSSITYQL